MIPHATQIATKGILGTTLGTSSKGFLIRIEEITTTTRTTGPAQRRDYEEKKKKDRTIQITIHAFGKKSVTTHVVSKGVKIGIEDVEIVDNGENIIGVTIRNLKS